MTRQPWDISDSLPLDAVWAGYELKWHPRQKPPWRGYLSSPETTVLTLTGSFVPSRYVLIPAEKLTLAFHLVTSGGPSTVSWFPEFSDDLTTWFREVAEEDAAGGIVLMPKTIRTFADNAGTQLADGTHDLSVQLVRQGKFARLQMLVSAGAATAEVTADGTSPAAAV